MSSHSDTIFALATPAGRSGVAVIRVCGPRADAALQALTAGRPLPMARMASLVALRSPETGGLIDRALAIRFPKPHSYTGDDMVELQVHGGRAVISELIETLGRLPGNRQAEPGEFTRRAFLNNKMDLTAIEGLADLIDAETSAQKTQALRAMQGENGRRYEELRHRILHSLAQMEALIDFPDEDIPAHIHDSIASELALVAHNIERWLADGRRGERIREGVGVVILGAPNAGKSSLMNALARRDVAIVSPQPGTTRDIIEVHLDIAGYPVVLVDTAGLRDTGDAIEEEGMRRALQRAANADITLVLLDGQEAQQQRQSMAAHVDDRTLLLITKADLLHKNRALETDNDATITISSKTGQGLDMLIAALEEKVQTLCHGAESAIITRARHRDTLQKALGHLNGCLVHDEWELQCEELRLAAKAIGQITGTIFVDELLGVIFSSFCIGK